MRDSPTVLDGSERSSSSSSSSSPFLSASSSSSRERRRTGSDSAAGGNVLIWRSESVEGPVRRAILEPVEVTVASEWV